MTRTFSQRAYGQILALSVCFGLFAGPALAQSDDDVLKFLNDPALTSMKLDDETGIGGVRADLILMGRTAKGEYGSVAQVLELIGIGPRTLDKIRAAVGGGNGGSADTLDARVLAFLNDPATSSTDIASKAGIRAYLARRIVAARANGAFNKISEVRAINGIGARTIERLRSMDLDDGSKPVPPDNPANLQQKLFAESMIDYVFEQNFWSWDVYPGLDSHRRKTTPMVGTGISAARDFKKAAVLKQWPFLDAATVKKGYKTMGTSFFNAPAAEYVHGNLYPGALFAEKIIKTGKKVEFPVDSVVVKALFVQIPEGLDTDGMKIIDTGTATGKLGLVQLDISTKQYSTWTWMTFSYQPGGDPKHFGLVPHVEDDTVCQTNYQQRYYGPVDNPKSSCIACHQAAQFPPVPIGAAVRRNDHHQSRPAAYMTSRGMGIRVDFIWEATQALTLEEEESGVKLDMGGITVATAIETMGAGDNVPADTNSANSAGAVGGLSH